MTRFIHTADWQIGKSYRQVGDEQKRFRLQQERLSAIGRIRDAARIQAAQFVVVVAGNHQHGDLHLTDGFQHLKHRCGGCCR